MVGTNQMAATAVVLIALAISWTPTGIVMAAPVEGAEMQSLVKCLERSLQHLQGTSQPQLPLTTSEQRTEGPTITEERMQRMEEMLQSIEERLAKMEEQMTHLVTSSKVDELPKEDAVLRKLEGNTPATSDPPLSALPSVEAASTSSGAATTPTPPMTPEERNTLGEILFEEAHRGRAQEVQRLLQEGADVDYRYDGFSTPLHAAAKEGHTDVMSLLITAGADLNARDPEEKTPMHLAASRGNAYAVRALTAAGAAVNSQDNEGRTPLLVAAEQGKVQAVQELIAAGADLNRRAKYSWAPLHYAAWNGHPEVIKALIAAGARKSILSYQYGSPYDVARMGVSYLLSQ